MFRKNDRITLATKNFQIIELLEDSPLARCLALGPNTTFFLPLQAPFLKVFTNFVHPLDPQHTPYELIDEFLGKVYVRRDSKVPVDLSFIEAEDKLPGLVICDDDFPTTGNYTLVIYKHENSMHALKRYRIKAPQVSNLERYQTQKLNNLTGRILPSHALIGTLTSIYLNGFPVDSFASEINHRKAFGHVTFSNGSVAVLPLSILRQYNGN